MPNLMQIDRLAETIAQCGADAELFYLASPYSAYAEGMHKAAEDAAKITSLLLDRGLIVISPIVHGHHVDVWSFEARPHEFWIRQGLSLLAQCRSLIVATLPGWEQSAGVSQEITFAIDHRVPIFYLDCDGLI